ncbi:hypothetical protein MPSI1_001274 [Malassezia psittaci]|uniref:Kelch repeat-containing proteins n=1 Tax=Malassezia psittaci TaxID=1821823 RepID=A0AAF0JDG7_9BASI|nr:hypothetical protein MPSI1_001274 [Malassezia psittaci]
MSRVVPHARSDSETQDLIAGDAQHAASSTDKYSSMQSSTLPTSIPNQALNNGPLQQGRASRDEGPRPMFNANSANSNYPQRSSTDPLELSNGGMQMNTSPASQMRTATMTPGGSMPNEGIASNLASGSQNLSSNPPGSLPPAAPQQPSTPERQRQQNIVYPWGKKTIHLNPPRFLDETRRAPAGVLSPAPFPRYGHATNQATGTNNEVYIFGGLVRDSVKNDMYIMEVEPIQVQRSTGIKMDVSLTATLVQTSGQAPLPRVGHAAVLVSNVFVLWGGDTKIRAEDSQDEALYLLNLNNREWTRVMAGAEHGRGPVGRYGHSLSIIGSNLLIFGGQVESEFFDELWRFDLNSLKGTPTWQLIRPNSPTPARRTGHSAVVHREKLYIFGGTDGNYHYNDTWCFDFPTQTWTELKCVGYIPAPREGHSACMVDDIMYIFGGRGVDGNDLGDLASFKISSHRWFMFAHMGPAPFGRSGHTMVTTQNRILVVGGESFTGSAQDDPTTLHVLDTSKIKYPAKTERGSAKSDEGSSNTAGAQDAPLPSTPGASTAIPTSAPPSMPEMQSPSQQVPQTPSASMHPVVQAPSPSQVISQPGSQLPPQRSHQPGASISIPGQTTSEEETRGVSNPSLISSPSSTTPYTATQPSGQFSSGASHSLYSGMTSAPPSDLPISGDPNPVADDSTPHAAPPLNTAVYLNHVGPHETPFQSSMLTNSVPTTNSSNNASRSSEPPITGPTNVPAPMPSVSIERAPSTNFAVTDSNKDVTSQANDSPASREMWLSSMLALAVKQGFVLPESNDSLPVEQFDTGVDGSEKEAMVKSLLTLKTQVSSLRADLGEQIKAEETRIASQERARIAALQEAAYYRAKLVASESTNVEERVLIERQRVGQLEKLLATATRENTELERKVGMLTDQAKLEARLRSLVEDRLGETTKRAVAAEEAHIKVYDEYSTLQKHSYVTESLLRDQTAQISSLSSALAQYQAERDSLEQSMSSKSRSADTSRATLAQFQEALNAAHARTAEYERQRVEHLRQAEAQSQTVMQLRTDLQARVAELAMKNGQLEQQATVVAELESIVSNLQREAQAHREAATGGLAQLLALQQAQNSQRDGAPDSRNADVSQQHLEHVQALQDEAQAMRQLHEEARSSIQKMAASLQQATERSNSLQRTNNKLFAEVTSQRKQLAQALHELSQVRDQSQTSRSSTEAHARELEEVQVKNLALRRLLAENHVEIPDEETLQRPEFLHDRHTAQLQRELEEYRNVAQQSANELQQAREELEHMHQELQQQQREAQAKDIAKARSDLEMMRARAEDAENRLEEATLAHQERTSQLENDYLTAVQFVRNTENMLRRLKDEHLKLRQDNAELRAGFARAPSAAANVEDQPRASLATRAN